MKTDTLFPQGRRQFLKLTAAAGLASLSSRASEASAAMADGAKVLEPDAELRVGMIGNTGHTGLVLNVLPQIPRARLAAYALRDGEREPSSARDEAIGAQVRKHPSFQSKTRLYPTYQEMLAKEALDVVGVCLPYPLNPYASIAAAEKGIHVFSEKPLATELGALDQLEEAVRRSGVRLSAMLEMRLWPPIQVMRETIQQGIIGEPVLVTGQKSYKFGDERPEFYKDRATYGGTIPWIGIHLIDLMLYTTGLRPTQVSAVQSNKVHKDYPGTEDNVGILFRLSNGGTAVMTLDYLRPKTAETHGDDRMRVIGSKGVIELREERVELITQSQPARELLLSGKGSIFVDFVKSLRGQGRHVLGPGEAEASTRICLYARKAADEGRILDLPGRS